MGLCALVLETCQYQRLRPRDPPAPRPLLGGSVKDPLVAPYLRNNYEKLFDSLTEVRNQGYAINDEESQRGLRGIAAPIFSPDGAIYALSITAPPEDVSVAELKSKYAPKLMAVSKEISEAIGYHETDTSPRASHHRSKGGR